MPGPLEMFVILVIVLIVFGPGKLPTVFKSMGQGLKSFRDAQRDGDDGIDVTPDQISEDASVPEVEVVTEASAVNTQTE